MSNPETPRNLPDTSVELGQPSPDKKSGKRKKKDAAKIGEALVKKGKSVEESTALGAEAKPRKSKAEQPKPERPESKSALHDEAAPADSTSNEKTKTEGTEHASFDEGETTTHIDTPQDAEMIRTEKRDDGSRLEVTAEEGEFLLEATDAEVVIAERKQAIQGETGPEASTERDLLDKTESKLDEGETVEVALDAAGEQVIHDAAETTDETGDYDPFASTQAASSSNPNTTPSAPNTSPIPPTVQPLSPHIMAPWHNNGVPAAPTMNMYPTGSSAANPNTAPTPQAEQYVYQDNGPVVAAGLLGYMVGRRHGRKRTEKRLKPVQEKLEKEVKHVKELVGEKTAEVKHMVAEQRKQKHEATEQRKQQEQDIMRQQAVLQEQQQAAQRQEATPPALRPEMALAAAGAVPAAALAMERYPQFGLPTNPEHPADMPQHAPEAPKQREPEAVEHKPVHQDVITLSRNELSEISEGIPVEGTTLRHIYDSGLISERGLRYIVSEYLQGHDIKRVVTNEIIEKQRDFERDPVLRDHHGQPIDQGGVSGGGSAFAQQASQVNDQSTQQADAVTPSKPKDSYQTKHDYDQHAGPDIVVAGGAIALVVIIIAIVVVALA